LFGFLNCFWFCFCFSLEFS